MAWIDKLVGKSPIKPMQHHMQVAVLCAREVIPLLEAMAAGDNEGIRDRRVEIDRLEHEDVVEMAAAGIGVVVR